MTHGHFRAKAVRSSSGPAVLTYLALVSCSSPPPPPPDTFVNLTLAPQSTNNLCSYASAHSVLAIGTPTGGSPQTMADQSQAPTGNVSVICTVGGGFDVSLSAAVGGNQGGTLTINGHVTTAGGSNITADFTSNGASYSENDCTIGFTYQGSVVPSKPPIAGGRIWGHLKCPSMTNPAQPKLVNGMQVPETCDGEADFLFDNCSQ
jgi:hypothetical protein